MKILYDILPLKGKLAAITKNTIDMRIQCPVKENVIQWVMASLGYLLPTRDIEKTAGI